jgi:hypothetical protein
MTMTMIMLTTQAVVRMTKSTIALLGQHERFEAGAKRLSTEFIRLLCSGFIVSPSFFFLLLAVSLLATVSWSLSTEW